MDAAADIMLKAAEIPAQERTLDNNIPMEQENLIEEDNDKDENDEPNQTSLLNNLRWNAMQFIMNVRENCKVSHTAIEQVIDGVTSLVELYSSIILEELRQITDVETNLINFDAIKRFYKEKYPPTTIFSEVATKNKLDQMLVTKCHMVPAKNISLDTYTKWKIRNSMNALPEVVDVTYDAYIVPFLDNLQNLLMNEEILSNIDNPKQHEDGLYRTVLDGTYYRENEFFRNHNKSLAIIFYYDDLGIANPLGGSSKVHKMSMFYWTLGNIHPELRSSQNAFQLYGIAKTDYLKKPGALQKILEPFMLDIKKLESEGININIKVYAQFPCCNSKEELIKIKIELKTFQDLYAETVRIKRCLEVRLKKLEKICIDHSLL